MQTVGVAAGGRVGVRAAAQRPQRLVGRDGHPAGRAVGLWHMGEPGRHTHLAAGYGRRARVSSVEGARSPTDARVHTHKTCRLLHTTGPRARPRQIPHATGTVNKTRPAAPPPSAAVAAIFLVNMAATGDGALPRLVSRSLCFGGELRKYAHAAQSTACTMHFNVYLPPAALAPDAAPVPVPSWRCW
jgi:hypothetical protein